MKRPAFGLLAVVLLAGCTSRRTTNTPRTAVEQLLLSSAVDHAMAKIEVPELRALVYDAPILRYQVKTEMHGEVAVLPVKFERQEYAVALPSNSPLREPINRAILRRIGQPN